MEQQNNASHISAEKKKIGGNNSHGTAELKLFCPENLDIEEVIKKHPFNQPGLKKDLLLFIIHSIIIQRSHYSERHLGKLGKREGYVPLYSKILKDKVPQYISHINYLIAADIIECDDSYRNSFINKGNEVSKGYKLTEKYSFQKNKRITITDYILRKKLRRKKQLDINSSVKQLYPYLPKWLNTNLLKIDVNGAMTWIDCHYEQEKIKIINNKSWKAEKKIKKNNDLIEKCEGFKTLVHRINDHDYYYCVDSSGTRFHSNITNLRKELRDFITYDNKALISVDLKNSQPYFSMLLFNARFWKSQHIKNFPSLKRINKNIYKSIRENKGKYKGIVMCLDSSETLTDTRLQEEAFFKNVIDGTFYEFLIEVFERELSLNSENSTKEESSNAARIFKSCKTVEEKRKKVKKIVLTLLFDNGNKIYNIDKDSATKIFNRRFPVIGKMFKYIKEDDYRNLAMVLQRIESFILLKVVCGRITKEKPHIPLFTIHDSIVTNVGNEEYVKSVIEDELRKIMGIPPQLAMEYWGSKV